MTPNLATSQTLSEMLLVYTCSACVMVVLLIVFGYISIKDTIKYFLSHPTKPLNYSQKTHDLPLISKV